MKAIAVMVTAFLVLTGVAVTEDRPLAKPEPVVADRALFIDMALQSTARAMECPGDMPYCTKNSYARDRVRKFRNGRLGRIYRGEHVRYPRRIRRKIIHGIIHVSPRYGRHDRKSAWQKFLEHDTCITWTDRNGSTWPAVCRNGVQRMRRLNPTEVTVLVCSSGFYLALLGSGFNPIAAGAGGVGCMWEKLWARRH